ncbi:MAG: hypothetical protein IH595_03785 [Bacteroidales bacterium]|nr:hypothetical protein [Bacteroidales bacterium]
MKKKSLGIIMAIIGVLMIVYTGFNYVTRDKVIDMGLVQINKETSHPVQWSPIVGGVILAGGIVVIATSKKSRKKNRYMK